MVDLRRWCVAATAVLLVGVVAPAKTGAAPGGTRPPQITVIEMGAPDGMSVVSGTRINRRGQVLVSSRDSNGYHQPGIWHRGAVTLPRPEGFLGSLEAISDRGHVAANFVVESEWPPPLRPFLWWRGELTQLPTRGAALGGTVDVNERGQVLGLVEGGQSSGPMVWDDGDVIRPPDPDAIRQPPAGINNRGQVALTSYGSGGHRAAIWQVGGQVTDLGTLGGERSQAVALNERGHVVGNSLTADGELHAFLWRDGEMTDLGTLGGVRSDAVALNERGHVVGTSLTADGDEHPFLWRDGEMTDLGNLGGDSWCTGCARVGAINNWDQIVGTSPHTDGQVHAFLWQDGEMIDLGSLATDEGFSGAYDINDRGQIAGRADGRGILWTARPIGWGS